MVECLTNASRTVGAELLVVTRTVEGDPIRRYYRNEPNGYGYTVFTDSSSDAFGSQRDWRVNECDGLVFSAGMMHCLVE